MYLEIYIIKPRFIVVGTTSVIFVWKQENKTQTLSIFNNAIHRFAERRWTPNLLCNTCYINEILRNYHCYIALCSGHFH